jgi:hypothetical protein
MIARFIVDSRDELQHSALPDKSFNRTVEQWIDRLRWLKTEHLEECYRLAMEAHSTRAPLIPKELLDAWHQLRKQPGFQQPQFQQQKLCEFWCTESGLILVDFDGKIVRQPSSKNEMLYVQACPHHRPQGLTGSGPQYSTFSKVRKYETTDTPSRPQPKAAAAAPEGWKSAGSVADAVAASVIQEDQQEFDDDVPF